MLRICDIFSKINSFFKLQNWVIKVCENLPLLPQSEQKLINGEKTEKFAGQWHEKCWIA